MSEENSIRQQARKGFQAVKDAVENVTGTAQDQTAGASEAAENVASSGGSQAASAFAQQVLDGVQRQAQQQFQTAGQLSITWARAYGEILTTSTNIYLDAVHSSWKYNRNLLDATGRVLEDAVDLQRRLTSEMSRTYQEYIDSVEEQYGNAQQ
ncbi:MAG TPA: hypothetical protein VLA19_06910 [Herpetosiphonaceae bacterium]|nr:hypothetical protein [Herpetosiphonaceae bacterium]